MTATALAAPPSTRDDIIGVLLATLGAEHFGTGPLAELRRMDPDPGKIAAAPPALHRLLARHVPDHWLHGEGLNRWALLIHLLARASPSPLHDFTALGQTLFDAGYNEGRLTTLLQARPSEFPIVLPRMVRFLVAKRLHPHPYQLASLVLHDDPEAARLAIARAYYRAEAKAA